MPLGKEHDKELNDLLKMGPSNPEMERNTTAFIKALKGENVTCETLKKLNEEIGPRDHAEVSSAKNAIAVVRDHKKCPQQGR